MDTWKATDRGPMQRIQSRTLWQTLSVRVPSAMVANVSAVCPFLHHCVCEPLCRLPSFPTSSFQFHLVSFNKN
uniref:Uncharacterized protein n=1 Tax=Anguilla anguilla TaxID=7936 RepID=A0A0E9XBV2_ANGAN